MKKLLIMGVMASMFAATPLDSQAYHRHHHHWSRKAKGTAIGAGTGAVVGGLAGGGKGAVIGGVAGAGAGYLIGRHKDRKHGHVYR